MQGIYLFLQFIKYFVPPKKKCEMKKIKYTQKKTRKQREKNLTLRFVKRPRDYLNSSVIEGRGSGGYLKNVSETGRVGNL